MMASFLKPSFSTLLALGLAGIAASAATSSGIGKGDIPSDLLFEPVPVSADENAIIDWRRASEAEVLPSENVREAIRYAWTPGEKQPSADEQEEIQAWVRRNRMALDLFGASLNKPKAQWPERNLQSPQPELTGLAIMTRARLVEADELADQQKFEPAAESLIGSLHLAQRGIEADASILHYMLASNVRTLVQGGMLRLASRSETPLPVMEKMLKELPSLDSETNTYAQILRVDFTLYTYPAQLDLQKLADGWAKISETNLAMWIYPEEFQRPFKILLDPSLVSQNPNAFDSEAEIQRCVRYDRVYRANSMGAWSERSHAVEDEREENGKKLLEDIEPLMKLTEGEPLPLSQQAARKVLPTYLQIEDPVGRIIQCEIDSLSGSDVRVFRCRTEREAVRAALAVLIFERKKGKLPVSLDDLVEENILDGVPKDPFAGKPLHYSQERRIVWSVGEDGIDNNGKGDPHLHWTSADAVWQIPEIK